MRELTFKVAAVLAMLHGVAAALVTAYRVEPVKATWSGVTDTVPGRDYVSQVITCNFDELDSASGGYVELFQGDAIGQSTYLLDIYEYPNGDWIAADPGRPQGKSSSWLKPDHIHLRPGKSFTKGKQYEFRFTRSGSDSIQFYYQDSANGGPYEFGKMLVGGTGYENRDLACRVYGRMRVVISAV